jgi:hypothetical protein
VGCVGVGLLEGPLLHAMEGSAAHLASAFSAALAVAFWHTCSSSAVTSTLYSQEVRGKVRQALLRGASAGTLTASQKPPSGVCPCVPYQPELGVQDTLQTLRIVVPEHVHKTPHVLRSRLDRARGVQCGLWTTARR